MCSRDCPEGDPGFNGPWFQNDENPQEIDRPNPVDLLTPRLCLIARGIRVVCSRGHIFTPDMETLVALGLMDTSLTKMRLRCSVPNCESLELTLYVKADSPAGSE
jgi:hypothetical protein